MLQSLLRLPKNSPPPPLKVLTNMFETCLIQLELQGPLKKSLPPVGLVWQSFNCKLRYFVLSILAQMFSQFSLSTRISRTLDIDIVPS